MEFYDQSYKNKYIERSLRFKNVIFSNERFAYKTRLTFIGNKVNIPIISTIRMPFTLRIINQFFNSFKKSLCFWIILICHFLITINKIIVIAILSQIIKRRKRLSMSILQLTSMDVGQAKSLLHYR